MKSKDYMNKALLSDLPQKDYNPIISRLKMYETSKDDPSLARLLHAAIGMSGESGEVLDSLKKSLMYGKPLNANNLKEECGDLLWYMSLMLHELGTDFETVMQMNIDKLSKRYPEGFTEKDAIERKDKNET